MPSRAGATAHHGGGHVDEFRAAGPPQKRARSCAWRLANGLRQLNKLGHATALVDHLVLESGAAKAVLHVIFAVRKMASQ